MNQFEKQHRICKAAETDAAYKMWRDIYLAYESAFTEYADAQPKEIQDILWGYAEGGRMMNQRLLNLACQYMDFSEVFPDRTI